MPVTHDPAFRLAVVALARIEGVIPASKMAGISAHAVRTWLAADAGVDHDDAEWDAAQKLAQSRHLQALIAGKPTGVGQWAMSAGISARNRRMVAVQKRWDARHGAAQEQPAEPEAQWLIELHALPEAAHRLMVAEVRAELAHRDEQRERREPSTMSEAEGEAALLDWVRQIAAMTEEQVAARTAELEAKTNAMEAAEQAAAAPERATMAPDPPRPAPRPPAPLQALPAPSSPVSPGLRVVSKDELDEWRDQAHLWHPID